MNYPSNSTFAHSTHQVKQVEERMLSTPTMHPTLTNMDHFNTNPQLITNHFPFQLSQYAKI